jgi:hypothetical protein
LTELQPSSHSTRAAFPGITISHAILGLQIKLIAGRDPKGFVPRFNIADRIATILAGRMGVGGDLPAQRGFALSFPPSLGESQKEALLATQSQAISVSLEPASLQN